MMGALNSFRNDTIDDSEIREAFDWCIYGSMTENAKLERRFDELLYANKTSPASIFDRIQQDNIEYYTANVKPIIKRPSTDMAPQVKEEYIATYAEPESKNTEVFDPDYIFEPAAPSPIHEECKPQSIDFKDSLDLSALSKQCYTMGKETKIDTPRLLAHLQRVLIYCNGPYGFKQIQSDRGGIETFHVVWHTEEDAQK
jgi:hypothetical protein